MPYKLFQNSQHFFYLLKHQINTKSSTSGLKKSKKHLIIVNRWSKGSVFQVINSFHNQRKFLQIWLYIKTSIFNIFPQKPTATLINYKKIS